GLHADQARDGEARLTPSEKGAGMEAGSVAGVGAGAAPVERTTELALKEKSKLIRSMRRFDMVFFTICAFVGLDTLGIVANNGGEGFTWLLVLAVAFVLPYALVMAEV